MDMETARSIAQSEVSVTGGVVTDLLATGAFGWLFEYENRVPTVGRGPILVRPDGVSEFMGTDVSPETIASMLLLASRTSGDP